MRFLHTLKSEFRKFRVKCNVLYKNKFECNVVEKYEKIITLVETLSFVIVAARNKS